MIKNKDKFLDKKKEITKIFSGKIILVTGGLGSIGSAIVQELLKYNPKLIRVVDNRETEIYYAIEERKNESVKYFFADVREKESIKKIISGVDIVFHAAAMKHVGICEQHPFEAVKTNILGTQNVIESCIEVGVEKMIFISTDKAVNPNSVMGTTKLLAERMVSAMNSSHANIKTKFGVVRFGNVLYSRGSVLEVWKDQLNNGEKITITDLEMTRFVMGIPQSIELIFSAMRYIRDSEIFILKMPSCKIRTLAEAYLEINGRPSNYYELIKPNEGEKDHEELLANIESKFLMENEQFFLRLPLRLDDGNIEPYLRMGFKSSKEKGFISNDERYLLDRESLKVILKKYINE